MMRSFRDPVDEWLIATVGDEASRPVTMLEKLTDQQFLFCLEYVKSGKLSEAAKKAKLPRSTNPSLLVHLPKIAACINILTAKREAELGKRSTAEILERLANTPVLSEDEFDFTDDLVQEREAKLARRGAALKEAPDDQLVEDIAHSKVDPGIMQLPKVQLTNAQSFGPQWVIERLVTVAERCMQIEPVYDRKGRPIGTFKFEPNAALKAMDLLGKTMALYKDRVEVAHEVSTFSDEELDGRLSQLAKQFPELGPVIEAKVTKKVANGD